MFYAHRYTDETTYQVIHYFNGGFRVIQPDQHDYLAWVEAGGKPLIEAVGRFLSVANGVLVVDPKKAATLAAEAAESKSEVDQLAAKEKAISDNLPSWTAIEAAINNADTVVKLRAIVLKLSRVLYWMAKNKAD
jgi:hypothetical protein